MVNYISHNIEKIFPFQSLFGQPTVEVRQDVINNLSQKALKAVHAGREQKPQEFEQLKKEFSQINSHELKGVLDAISTEEEGLETLDSLAQILTPEKLEECLGIKSDEATRRLVADLVEGKKISPTTATYISSFIDSICHSFDLFMHTVGIAELFRPAEGHHEFRDKTHLFFLVTEFLAALTSIALACFVHEPAEFVLVGVIVGFILLNIIYPHIARTPSELPFAENWTRKCKFGEFNAQRGKSEAVDEIAHALKTNEIVKTHPLLVGKPGVGKSETVKAFVQAIEQGEYPELSGKKVFYIDVANLLGKTDRTRVLNTIRDAIGRHHKDVILVLDQVHLATRSDSGFSLGHQLKTFLEADDGFPFVIGMTSDEEFHSGSSALAEKFKEIKIEGAPPEETAQILKSALAKRSGKMLIDPSALRMLIDKTNKGLKQKAVQPASSLKVLSLCAERIDRSQEKKEKGNLDRMFQEIAKAKVAFKRGHHGKPDAVRPLLTHAYLSAKEAEIRKEAKRLGVEVEITPELVDKVLN